jgi:hypothetical protein
MALATAAKLSPQSGGRRETALEASSVEG